MCKGGESNDWLNAFTASPLCFRVGRGAAARADRARPCGLEAPATVPNVRPGQQPAPDDVSAAWCADDWDATGARSGVHFEFLDSLFSQVGPMPLSRR